MKNIKSMACVLAIGLTLIAQFASPLAVYADGESTPPPGEAPAVTTTLDPTEVIDVPETASTPVPTELTADPAGTSTPVPPTESTELQTNTSEPTVDPVETGTSLPPADQTEPAAEVVATEEAAEEPTVLEILQEIPEGTDLVVLDENGEPEPLATQDAAEIIVTGDPIWCPDGIPPGGTGCTTSYPTMNELLTSAGAYINGNGTIWITSGSVGDITPVTINGSTYSNWANYSLTLQGGWSGNLGDTTTGSNSVFTVPITIANWNGTVTVNSITVNGGSGSSINTTGDVTVTNSTFSESTGNGLSVSNGGAVTATDSTFSGSTGTGLYVWTAGDITLDNIIADGNAEGGLWLKNDQGSDVTITDSTLTNNSYGMHVQAGGDLVLNHVNASNNTSTITENQSWWSGVLAAVQGNIAVSNSTFDGNTTYGLHVYNADGTGDVTITDSSFKNNNGTGLDIWSAGGITLTNITANGNGDGGLWLKNDYGTGDVTITGSMLTNNSYGMHVTAGGDLMLNNVNASNNTSTITEHESWWSGVLAIAQGNIIIDGGAYSNNTSYGIYIRTPAEIELTNVTANENMTGLFVLYSGNVDLWGVQASGNQVGVDIRDSGTATITGGEITGNETGLFVSESGDVELSDVIANGNQVGVDIRNSDTVNITAGNITENGIGLNVKCVQSITFNPSQENIVHDNTTNLIIDPSCPEPVIIDVIVTSYVTSQSQGEFELNCIGQSGFAVNLPNGDLVNIFCPVTGRARIYRVDNTTLPADLPAGYTYASAYTLDIIQNDVSIPAITEGGYIKASFIAQPLQPGNSYSVLYWDKENAVWVPLKEFLLDENGTPRSFRLFPDTPDDIRKIISGVRLVERDGVMRVEVSTNFPGIFVLVQH